MEPEYGNAAARAATRPTYAALSFTAPRTGGIGMTGSRPVVAPPRSVSTTDPVSPSMWQPAPPSQLFPSDPSLYVPPLERTRPYPELRSPTGYIPSLFSPADSGVAMYGPMAAGGSGLPVLDSTLTANLLTPAGYTSHLSQRSNPVSQLTSWTWMAAPAAPILDSADLPPSRYRQSRSTYISPAFAGAPPLRPRDPVIREDFVVPQLLRDMNDVSKVDLRKLIVPVGRLGGGAYGTVLWVKLREGANAHGLPLAEDVDYAMKVTRADYDNAAAEAEIGEVIRRSAISLLNLVPNYYWLRWQSDKEQLNWLEQTASAEWDADDPTFFNAVMYLLFMPIQIGTTLYDITFNKQLTPVRGEVMQLDDTPLNIGGAYGKRTLFSFSVMVQFYAAFAALREVFQDFTNPDAHGDNIMLSRTGVPAGIDSIIYIPASGKALFVPLQITGGLVLRMLDLGMASGEYSTRPKQPGDASVLEMTMRPYGELSADVEQDALRASLALQQLYKRGYIPNMDQELFETAGKGKTQASNYFINALANFTVFSVFRVDDVDRDTLDARYKVLIGKPRLRNFESMIVHLRPAGTRRVAAIQSAIGTERPPRQPMCHVCRTRPAQYSSEKHPEKLYCGYDCLAQQQP